MQINKRLILVGCGAFARELIAWVEDAVDAGIGQKITGYLDDTPHILEKFAYPYEAKWIATIDDYVPEAGDELIMAINDPVAKSKVVLKLKQKGAKFISFIHPSAIIARSAILGEGVVICPQSRVSADAQVGNFVTINCVSGVAHDVTIGDFTTLSAYVDLTGYVQVGDGVFFGSGTKVIPKRKIGSWAKIGAGSTIIRSVPENAIMYTQPAKRLERA
jgi:sugar O-acyltransferase (sialic acid O-acetyltransferase NeuD family)